MDYQKYKNEFQEILNSALKVEETVFKLNKSPENIKMIDALAPEASHTVVLIRGLFREILIDIEEVISCTV